MEGPPRDAVITVPAYFTDDQRRDTKLAGEKAGLNVLRLLPEPTAAAIAIGLDKGRDQTILVYDLGGGTFDVSILKVENNSFKVLAVNGNHDLGGNDFDAALREYALDAFTKQSGIDLRKEAASDPEVRQAMQTLTLACEQVKMELSDAEQAFLDLPNFFQGSHLEANVTRGEFEGLIKNLVYSTKDLALKTIGEAKGRCRPLHGRRRHRSVGAGGRFNEDPARGPGLVRDDQGTICGGRRGSGRFGGRVGHGR